MQVRGPASSPARPDLLEDFDRPRTRVAPRGQPAGRASILSVADPIASDLGADVDICDREPIHIPGSIQPHGLLLVVDAAGLTVCAGAGRLEAAFGGGWLGARIDALLGANAAERLIEVGQGVVSLGSAELGGEVMDVRGHRQDQLYLVEAEPRVAEWGDAARMLTWLDASGGVFERASDVRDLCGRAVQLFRELTGFDRVMIYRFLDDGAGVVVAEDKAADLHDFMNHHFPASDIPRQARALYVRNRVRVIPDVDYAPAPIRPAEAGHRGLDLSDVDLRSVSPVHIRYLKNMGVAASASISIVKDGLLWGLVACHNATPRLLSAGQRMGAQVLAGSLARQVRAREEAEDYRERLRLRAAEDVIVGRLSRTPDVEGVFAEVGDAFMSALGADGFAVITGKALSCTGRCPDPVDVREIASWAARAGGGQTVHTHALSLKLAAARDYQERASGVLAAFLPGDPSTTLIWLRAEEREVITWAGDPHKAVKLKPGESLTPRASFEAWREEVRGRARPWRPGEVEGAGRLLRALFDARQSRRLRELNRELASALEDKEGLIAQKDYLIREVNHRIQNSLQLVSAFLGLQARAEGDATLSRHLGEAQRRLSAVALVHRRLYGDDTVQLVDLARYLDDLVAEVRTSMGEEWAGQIVADLAPISVPADVAVNVGLILTELVINAAKYAYDGGAGPLSLTLEQHRNRLRLIVADRGRGKAAGGRQGFGARMLKAMVDRLQGELEEGDNHPGLRVILTAPIPPMESAGLAL